MNWRKPPSVIIDNLKAEIQTRDLWNVSSLLVLSICSVRVQATPNLTLSSCSFVCDAERQKRMRPSMRGVAGKPTPTVAIFLVRKVRTTALQKQHTHKWASNRRDCFYSLAYWWLNKKACAAKGILWNKEIEKEMKLFTYCAVP